MSPNKLTNEEMGALLGAFSDMRKESSAEVVQTTLFKACLIFCNIYIILTSILYILLRQNIIVTLNPELLSEILLTAFSGKAAVLFWFLAGVNMSLYFDVGFRIVSLCGIIYILNSVADGLVLYHEMTSFSAAPYFSLLIATGPVLAGALAVMVLSYKSPTEKI